MRQSGAVADVRHLGPHDHVCWGFDDFAEFRAAALTFLEAGLGGGQRVWYMGESEDGVRDALTGARPGAVWIVPLAAYDPNNPGMNPTGQIEAYATATTDALAAGFTGLRVAADVTTFVRCPSGIDAFARYEHRVDRLMATRPFSAMCAYNRKALGPDVITQLSVMHPMTNPMTTETAPFRLYASHRPGCAAAIGGELDRSSVDLLELALARAELRPTDGELVLDATELTFIDHRSLNTLADHARSLDATLVLRTDQSIPRRLTKALDWDNVTIEPVS
jgi:anti-anti-sigma regulatory factor